MVEDIPLEEARTGDDRAGHAQQGSTSGMGDSEAEEVVHDSAAEPDFLSREVSGAGETEMSLMGLGAAQADSLEGKRAVSGIKSAAEGHGREVDLPSSGEAETGKGDTNLITDPEAAIGGDSDRVQGKPRKQGPAKAQTKKAGKPRMATARPQKKRGKPKKGARKAQASKLVQPEELPQYGLVDEAGDEAADT